MKKFRGKALAALLSLALVASSFPVTLASASTTKTMSGIVNHQKNDDLYLVNGGNSNTVDLKDWLVADDTLQTNKREGVSDTKISAVSHVSGDSLVSLSLSNDGDTATLKLKSATKDGTEVVSVLYKGDYTDDDGTDYTVKARKNLTVHVFDKDALVFGEARTSAIDAGKAPTDLKSMAKTRNTEVNTGIYVAEPDDAGNTAKATYGSVALTNDTKTSDTIDVTAKSTAAAVYSVDVTNGEGSFNLPSALTATASGVATTGGTVVFYDSQVADKALTAVIGKSYDDTNKTYKTDGSTTNVTLTFKKVVNGKISTNTDEKYTLKTKIDDKVNVDQAVTNAGGTPSNTADYTVLKGDNGKTQISGLMSGSATTDKPLDVTNSILVFNTTGKVTVNEKTNLKGVEGTVGSLDVGDGRVGDITLDSGDVALSDGKAGKITIGTDDTDAAKANVTISSGTAGDIDVTDATDGNAVVKISGGTVGNVTSNDSITVDSNDEDTKIVTGTLKAPDMTVYADEASVTVGGLKAKKDGTITVKGDTATIKSIDLDSRTTTLQLGDSDDEFVGSVPAPVNAVNSTIEAVNDDTRATVNGKVDVDTIDLSDTSSKVTFDGDIKAGTIEGDGTMTIKAGSLYVSGSVSSATLKLSDSTLAAGTTVLKAKSDSVDADDFNCYGFTMTKSAGTTVDTFKIDTLKFAGLGMSKTTSSIAKGQTETFTASAYPGGTSLPTGYTIGWELDGGSSDVFTMTSSGNTATVAVNSIDPNFASENKTTLTAKLYDADGYEVDEADYGKATCDITAVAVPAINSDTTHDFTMAPGASYQFKITASTAPTMTAGSAGVLSSITNVGVSGNAYFIKVTAAANAAGKETGIYVNGTKLLVIKVAGTPVTSFTSDTTSNVTVKKGSSYSYKITASTAPSFGIGSAGVFNYTLVSHSGNAYIYKITAVGAVGAQAGIYVNGTKVNVAKVG